jgi:hypothetical protein
MRTRAAQPPIASGAAMPAPRKKPEEILDASHVKVLLVVFASRRERFFWVDTRCTFATLLCLTRLMLLVPLAHRWKGNCNAKPNMKFVKG